MSNADVVLKNDATVEDLIDVIEGNRIYIPCIYVLNKIDQISIEELLSLADTSSTGIPCAFYVHFPFVFITFLLAAEFTKKCTKSPAVTTPWPLFRVSWTSTSSTK